MQITSKKEIAHHEVITFMNTYEVRVQIKKGVILTLEVSFEDGEFQSYEPKNKKDKDIIDELTRQQSDFLDSLLEEIET